MAPSQKHSYGCFSTEGYLGTSGVCRNYKDLGDHWIPNFFGVILRQLHLCVSLPNPNCVQAELHISKEGKRSWANG